MTTLAVVPVPAVPTATGSRSDTVATNPNIISLPKELEPPVSNHHESGMFFQLQLFGVLTQESRCIQHGLDRVGQPFLSYKHRRFRHSVYAIHDAQFRFRRTRYDTAHFMYLD